MLHNCATKIPRTLTTLRGLLTATAAAVILAVTACSGEEPLATAQPDTKDERPALTIEAVARKSQCNQTKAAVTAEAVEPNALEQTGASSADRAPRVAATTDTSNRACGTDTAPGNATTSSISPRATRMILQTHSGPGICGMKP